ncbi:DUF3761 domain-containing protein [Burkholderia plantarii]|uniref:DUF3761 domain-containing protein n=1 Tax=Burkholderia plantarii TaxID=41899 RepID=UPI0018DCA0EB|nr:DUF3761 domain-containing protein [Burkholderia plantarii]MBI0327854.1 DUF3761 domain-containing protein [Burkholderia plantarii]
MMLAAAFAACLLAAGPAGAYQSASPDEARLQEHGHYRNRDGDEVHSPAHTKDGRVPEGASAKCRDGSYSFSRHRSGTCSHHGGVAEWE